MFTPRDSQIKPLVGGASRGSLRTKSMALSFVIQLCLEELLFITTREKLLCTKQVIGLGCITPSRTDVILETMLLTRMPKTAPQRFVPWRGIHVPLQVWIQSRITWISPGIPA